MNAPSRAREINNLNMSIREIQAIHEIDVDEINSVEEINSTDTIHSVHSVGSNHDTLSIPVIPEIPDTYNNFDTTSKNIAKTVNEKLKIHNTSIDIITAEENNITHDNL